jgi:exosortase
VAMVIFIQGAVLLTCGKATFKRFLFPLAYLFLAIPLPWQVSVLLSTPLKVLSARISAVVLDAFGFTVLRQGTILQFPEFTIGVAEVCSGLQSIFTLVIASIPIAYLTGASHGRILAIFLASVFLGSAANVTRIVVTAVLVSKAGPKVAEGLPHTALGMVIVFLAFLLLYGFASVISRRRGQQAGD